MMTTDMSSRVSLGRSSCTFLALLLLLAALGCGKYTSNAMNNPGGGGPAATANAQFRIGDGPADRVTSFEMSIGPVMLNPSSGAAISVLPKPQRVELSHLAGTTIPLATVNVPAGSYTSITLTASNPEVTFINNLGQMMKIEPTVTQTVTVNFNPAVTISTSPVISLDLNLASALTSDSQGNITGVNLSAAAFTLSTQPVASDENNEQEESGKLEDVTGMVSSVNGSSFTMTVGQTGIALTFSTDSNTEFKDGASLSALANMMVRVEGVTKADGSMYAREVEGTGDENGMQAAGLITNVSGNPATQITLLTQDGEGSGMDDSKVGAPMTIDVTAAQYEVSSTSLDVSGLGTLPSLPNFPFDSSTVHAGQSVEVDSPSGMEGEAVGATKIRLQQQGLRGTVSGLSTSTSSGPVVFTLTVPADSAFAMISGLTSVQVFWQAGTDLHDLDSVSNGQAIQVRGLVFFTGTGFNMIARRIESGGN
ncbi:MAG TPA: DUF5666 domain-containing protein [Candidatus Sulfotelmatobacter sp.]|nr:DUF5666 domain-containing protein [Candidatus Sulfotelmatobacter sp.]